MFPHIFIFRPDKTEPQKECAESKAGIFRDCRLLYMGAFQIDGLCGNGKGKRNIRPHFPCMERAFKTAPLQRSLGKDRMQVQCVVPCPIVMVSASILSRTMPV